MASAARARRRSGEPVTIDPHDPRAVAVRLDAALGLTALISPPELRAPIGDLLRAAIELCERLAAADRSLLGQRVMHELALANALLGAAADLG